MLRRTMNPYSEALDLPLADKAPARHILGTTYEYPRQSGAYLLVGTAGVLSAPGMGARTLITSLSQTVITRLIT